jgi:aerobic carbon-monoxide dehydrogenase medium subunit
VPSVPSGAAIVHRKLALHERPAATVTCLVRLDSDRIAEARIAVGSVGAVPVRAPSAEALLMDSEGPDVLRAAGEVAAEASGAVDDAGGSAEYKRQLVRVLVERALREALEEAI